MCSTIVAAVAEFRLMHSSLPASRVRGHILAWQEITAQGDTVIRRCNWLPLTVISEGLTYESCWHCCHVQSKIAVLPRATGDRLRHDWPDARLCRLRWCAVCKRQTACKKHGIRLSRGCVSLHVGENRADRVLPAFVGDSPQSCDSRR